MYVLPDLPWNGRSCRIGIVLLPPGSLELMRYFASPADAQVERTLEQLPRSLEQLSLTGIYAVCSNSLLVPPCFSLQGHFGVKNAAICPAVA